MQSACTDIEIKGRRSGIAPRLSACFEPRDNQDQYDSKASASQGNGPPFRILLLFRVPGIQFHGLFLSTTNLGCVPTLRQFDSNGVFTTTALVILLQPLSETPGFCSYDRIALGTVVAFPPENLGPNYRLLEFVIPSCQMLLDYESQEG